MKKDKTGRSWNWKKEEETGGNRRKQEETGGNRGKQEETERIK